MKAPLPEDEEHRLAVLREYEILDTPPEVAFDGLTQLAAHICQTPMALVSLIDQDRQWFKAQVGLSASETPRDMAFCAHAILRPDELMEVRDATQDDRFAGNPLVTGDPHIRYYAGAPLVAHDNQPLGTLCVIDRQPRKLTPAQLEALQTLSRHVVAQLELRRQAKRLAVEVEEKQRFAEQLSEQNAQLTRSEQETGRLLELAEKSRNALLSVLEDEQRLGKELRRWADAFENCAQGILIGTPGDAGIFACNQAFASLHGSAPEDIRHRPLLSLFRPGDRESVGERIVQANAEGQARFELPMVRADGSTFEAQVDLVSVRETDGAPLYWVVTIQNVTDRKLADLMLARTNRALKLMSACNEALVRAEDEQGLLSEVCRLAVEIGGYRMAWVGFAMADENKSIRPMAWAGHEDDYLSAIRLSWAEGSSSGQGPAARCIRTGETVVCEDLTSPDARFFWKDEALKRGYAGLVCLPLHEENRVYGVLALYAADVQQVGADEVKLLVEMAEDLAFGIRHIRSFQDRQRLQDVVLKVSQAVSAGHGEDFFQSVTRHMVEALEADGGMVGRLAQHDTKTVETRALFMDGVFEDNLSYPLVGTPCEGVSLGYTSLYEKELQGQFPSDSWLRQKGLEAYAGIPLLDTRHQVCGIMSVFFRRPLAQA
ncbi:MAG TPA: GAF domain-containing protein, partial [Prosthecobacter sp.]